MTRTLSLIAVVLLVPHLSAAQAPPAPAAPLPPVITVPAIPPIPTPPDAVPMVVPEPPAVYGDLGDLGAVADRARAAADRARANIDVQAIKAQAREMAQDQRQMMELSGQLSALADVQNNMPFKFAGDRGAAGYDSGMMLLQQHQYDRAITAFDRVITDKAPRADGALYWKAFAEYKLAHTQDALAAIASLRTDYPQSRYLGDAKVLEVDVRKSTGQPVDLNTLAADEEIKILAIQGIQKSAPDRAIPLLEGVLTQSNPLQVKKQAIYVLALSDDPRAHDVLMRYAKGAGNPDLQVEAIRYLASRRDKQTTSADLRSIYESSPDPSVRRAVIDAYRMTGDKAALIAIATSINAAGSGTVIARAGADDARPNPNDVRASAIGALTGLAAPQDLWALYQQEQDPGLRGQIVGVLASMGAVDQLVQIAKTDKDQSIRQRAIRSIGQRRDDRAATPALLDLYKTNQDKATRQAVIQSLGDEGNADALVSLAKTETDLDLKRDIVRRLSDMAPRSKVAADYMMDVLK